MYSDKHAHACPQLSRAKHLAQYRHSTPGRPLRRRQSRRKQSERRDNSEFKVSIQFLQGRRLTHPPPSAQAILCFPDTISWEPKGSCGPPHKQSDHVPLQGPSDWFHSKLFKVLLHQRLYDELFLEPLLPRFLLLPNWQKELPAGLVCPECHPDGLRRLGRALCNFPWKFLHLLEFAPLEHISAIQLPYWSLSFFLKQRWQWC